ncbi:MAG TPA: DegT/DnrJ/EryC1/StrS family aminotransferase [Pseudonocardiaceae bacterium]|jgi:dTDP-4-amino-4,6-dideoxygalactose transaminase|nr:DegT/DnrJ/EryC1/StrS family aminotransferase [Pseudonocardiaceae bacterium]
MARSAAEVTRNSRNNQRPVPFFTQAESFAALWPLISEQVNDVIDRGKFSHGHKVAELERALAEYTGAAHVIGVNSGTDALVILLRAAGIEPGDEVIVPAFSFIASASAVVLAGGRPVFADIEPDSYALDPSAAADAVTARTRFLLPAHLFCQLADLDGLVELADRRGLTMVEDSAEAIGMRWNGRHAGRFGAGGVLSFFPTKTLGAIGDAGAVLTDDPHLAAVADALRHHGRAGHTINHFPGIATPTAYPGMNSKMDDLQAAVLLAKLTRLDAEISRRNHLADAYSARLRGCPGIRRLPAMVRRTATTNRVCYVYLIEVDARDELADWLAGQGIGTETYYPAPLHLQPCFADLGHRPGDFPVAEAACARTLALPLYPDLTDAEVDVVCAAVRRFFGERG